MSKATPKPKDPSRVMSRQALMQDILGQVKAGDFSPSAYAEAKQSASELGVSSRAFDAGLQRKGVSIPPAPSSGGATPPAKDTVNPNARPVGSGEQATQNVMFQREFGSGLGELKSMQDPNYALGSGSSLQQPARAIGTQSGAMNRAARRLRRQGYFAQAAQMASDAEKARLGEPSISTQAQRGLETAQRIQQGQLAQAEQEQQGRIMGYVEDLLKKRASDPGGSGRDTPDPRYYVEHLPKKVGV